MKLRTGKNVLLGVLLVGALGFSAERNLNKQYKEGVNKVTVKKIRNNENQSRSLNNDSDNDFIRRSYIESERGRSNR